MSTAEIYQRLRPLMFSIAYRMLGSVSEAEDIVQEAFLRYHAAQPRQAEIGSPKAYLSAVTTRLCIDHLRSARARREAYPGEWLPEPLLTGEAADPAGQAEQTDSLSMAFLLVLERLSLVERAVFLLHDVFSYGYEEIARIVGKSEDNCRQLALRARRHVTEHNPGSRPHGASGRNSPRGSSARSGAATWTASFPCSPPTSWCTATAAGPAPRGRAPSPAATAWSG